MAAPAPATLELVADDPIRRAELVQALLEEGFQVVQRPFSRVAAELLPARGGRHAPQLLILQPPVAPGLSTVQTLVQALRRRDSALPLLLLLDGADEQLRAAVLDAGADDVLVHPIGLREFVARCRAILRRTARSRPSRRDQDSGSVLEVGPIRLDRLQCRVTLAGEEVMLTPREFRLLECFMQHPGRALSREQLIEQVWGPDYSGDSKSVDVHVLWLRRKLDVGVRNPQIFITVRGIGYRLDPPRG
ncbi:MAG: winged helix-turn-helix domain-containing protein [Cyanobium sp.]